MGRYHVHHLLLHYSVTVVAAVRLLDAVRVIRMVVVMMLQMSARAAEAPVRMAVVVVAHSLDDMGAALPAGVAHAFNREI